LAQSPPPPAIRAAAPDTNPTVVENAAGRTGNMPAQPQAAEPPPKPKGPMEEIVRLPLSPKGLAFSPDSKRVAFILGASKYNCVALDTVKVLFEGFASKPAIGDGCWFNSILVAPDGNLVTSNLDLTIRVFGASDGKEIRRFNPVPLGQNFVNLRYSRHGDWVVGISDTRRRDWVVGINEPHQVRIWDYKSGEELKRYRPPSPVKSLDVHPDGKRIVTLHEDNVVRVWDALTGASRVEFPDLTKRVARVSFSPGGRQLLCLPHGIAESYLVNPENGALIQTFKSLTNILDAAFFASELRVATVSADNVLRVWSVDTGEKLYTSTQFDKDIRSLDVSPDGNYVVVIVEGETIVYRVRS
jgi:WD40 repeat protein